jgi:hypothetical protein
MRLFWKRKSTEPKLIFHPGVSVGPWKIHHGPIFFYVLGCGHGSHHHTGNDLAGAAVLPRGPGAAGAFRSARAKQSARLLVARLSFIPRACRGRLSFLPPLEPRGCAGRHTPANASPNRHQLRRGNLFQLLVCRRLAGRLRAAGVAKRTAPGTASCVVLVPARLFFLHDLQRHRGLWPWAGETHWSTRMRRSDHVALACPFTLAPLGERDGVRGKSNPRSKLRAIDVASPTTYSSSANAGILPPRGQRNEAHGH